MSQDPRFKAVAVRSPRGGRLTSIDWADGHKSEYPHDRLRGYCPCAGCQGHSGEIHFLETTDAQRELEDIQPVGSYALALHWFDGHTSGIYSFQYLRALCPCDACRASSDRAGSPPAAGP